MDEPWVTSKKRDLEVPEDAVINPPISRPSKIICIGRNYKAHAEELKHSIPEEPVFFAKAPSAVIGHKQDIIIPSWLNTRVDHEAELGIIIGKQAKNVTEDNALDYVAGFTIVNDITAREMQKTDIKNGNPWFPSKSIDTFMPVGPFIVPADVIENPDNLEIELKVNNETRQKASTKDMIFNIGRIISYITKFMTLEPGDIIATGTPEGVSPVKHGDVIDISISGLGTLTNKVIQQGL
ncbi:fumarylacetoacetate hydrolase family protein [bacterium]|nr:fumarylacetoacetate hydrolase family protein [bacterium]